MGVAVLMGLGRCEEPEPKSVTVDARSPVEAREGPALEGPKAAAAPQAEAATAAELAEARAEPRAYAVDLSALQRVMPGNLYWSLGAPTDDERLKEVRAEDARRRNAARGKIEAGEATDDEILAYFEAQRRLHQDYLDLSNRVLQEYGAVLPERDRGLYELGANMHRDRLAELPRLEAEAIERKRVQDQRRKEWEAAGKPR